jgi:hypothetical protein
LEQSASGLDVLARSDREPLRDRVYPIYTSHKSYYVDLKYEELPSLPVPPLASHRALALRQEYCAADAPAQHITVRRAALAQGCTVAGRCERAAPFRPTYLTAQIQKPHQRASRNKTQHQPIQQQVF